MEKCAIIAMFHILYCIIDVYAASDNQPVCLLDPRMVERLATRREKQCKYRVRLVVLVIISYRYMDSFV